MEGETGEDGGKGEGQRTQQPARCGEGGKGREASTQDRQCPQAEFTLHKPREFPRGF